MTSGTDGQLPTLNAVLEHAIYGGRRQERIEKPCKLAKEEK